MLCRLLTWVMEPIMAVTAGSSVGSNTYGCRCMCVLGSIDT